MPDDVQSNSQKTQFRTIDLHVGSRLRILRQILGMSQKGLSDALGVTPRQVHEFENGISRVGSSRLFDLAGILKVPVFYFFGETPQSFYNSPTFVRQSHANGFDEVSEPFACIENENVHTVEGFEVARAYLRIKDPAIRKRMSVLMAVLAVAEPMQES